MEALLIIDVQEAYVNHLRQDKNFLEGIDYINTAAELFRKAGKAVIVVRHISKGSGGEYNNVKELEVKVSDREILKKFNSSFWETELEEILNSLGVKFLVLSGYAAEYCVSATFFAAVERGFVPTLLQNGVLAHSPEGLISSNISRPQISLDAIEHILNK